MWQEKSGANRCLVRCSLCHSRTHGTPKHHSVSEMSFISPTTLEYRGREHMLWIVSPPCITPRICPHNNLKIGQRFGVGANCGHEKTLIEAVHIAHRTSVTTLPPHPALLAIGPIIETFLADKPNFLPSLSVFLAQLCFPDLMFHNKFMVK